MFDFGIADFRPLWLSGRKAVTVAHADRLRGLEGRTLTRTWLVWDVKDDEWFCDCPVLLDFAGEQIEINHWKFDDVSITWNAIDPHAAVRRPGFELQWRENPLTELRHLQGQTLESVELLELTGIGMAQGAVDVSFVFPQGRVTVYNALDENGLTFEPPDVKQRRHPLR
ncbi:hypothetical protein [Streptomyces sp. NPDC058572]|uniref:hypothetical protein n=1 Tax=Streptomyces sp. NPDC058572 TaxID=3346546 RepID=UPI00365C944E